MLVSGWLDINLEDLGVSLQFLQEIFSTLPRRNCVTRRTEHLPLRYLESHREC
jgi:hypothetical protein